MSSASQTVYTVGHSNGPAEDFLALLGSHAIDAVVDVRSSPSSRYTPHFGGEQLRRRLEATGLRYLFFGRELGGRPSAGNLYDPDGHVRYDLLAATATFQAAIGRLATGAAEYRIAVMCGEEDPVSCHRRRLVGRALIDRGIGIAHIRHSGSIESERDAAIREALKYPKLYQLSWDGATTRRSIHPVKDRVQEATGT